MADFGASAASVHVAGLLLNVSSSLNNAALTAVKADLATLLGVADTRFTYLEISNAWIGGVAMSALEFTITASASKTATSLAQQLAETVQNIAAGSNALSSYSSALKTAVSSQVYQLKGLIMSFTIIVNLACRCVWLWPLLPSRRTTRTLCTVALVVQLDTLKMVWCCWNIQVCVHDCSIVIAELEGHLQKLDWKLFLIGVIVICQAAGVAFLVYEMRRRPRTKFVFGHFIGLESHCFLVVPVWTCLWPQTIYHVADDTMISLTKAHLP